jgi:allantoinase
VTEPREGMDHDLYPFSAMPERPALAWPGGARMAVCVLIHLEHWELEPPEGAWKDTRFSGEYGFYFPEYRPFTQREYGNRIGLFRVLKALEGRDLKLTVAANASALERYPRAVESLLNLGAEFVAHGEYQSRMLTSELGEVEERGIIKRTSETFERILGHVPRGWLGPDSGESPQTPQLLAEAGYDHVLDWPNDDQPYLFQTSPPLVSIPNQMEWDDVTALWLRKVPNPRYPELVGEAAEALAGEGGRSFMLSLHPWVIGQPHRVRYLRDALDRLCAVDNFWSATASEIADHCRQAWGAPV